MTVNELIVQLDLLPADAEIIMEGDHNTGVIGNLGSVNLTEDGTVVLSV